jgi:hypothetical protein
MLRIESGQRSLGTLLFDVISKCDSSGATRSQTTNVGLE